MQRMSGGRGDDGDKFGGIDSKTWKFRASVSTNLEVTPGGSGRGGRVLGSLS